MKKFKRITTLILVMTAALSFVLLAGCSSSAPQARKALEDYLSGIKTKDYSAAFKLVSDFDKRNMTEEIFNEWRQSADRIVEKKAFSIGDKTDRFKNYEYMGTRFEEAYGFDVKWDQKYLVEGAETSDYDKDAFKIMAVKENGSFKIALLISDLKERTDSYNKIH